MNNAFSSNPFIEILMAQKDREDALRPEKVKDCAKGEHEVSMAWSETKIPLMEGSPGPTRAQWYCKWCRCDLGITEGPGFKIVRPK